MASEPFYRKLIVFLFLIAVLAIASAYLWFAGNKIFVIFPLLIMLAAIISLLKFLNRTNHDLALFFEALVNEDSSLNLNRKRGIPGFVKLNKSIRTLSNTIGDERMNNKFQEQFYQKLIDHSKSGLLAYDEQGYVKIANPAMCNLIGVRHLASLKTLENRFPELYNAISCALPGEPLLFKHRMQNSQQLLQIRLSEFIFGKKNYHLFSFQNIKAELDEKEVESWQKLFKIMSHEIMNSLTPITSLAQTIGQNIPEIGKKNNLEKIRHSALTIEEQGKLMMSFVENYRKFYKIPKPVFKNVSTEDFLSRFRILFNHEIEKNNIDFTVQSERGISTISCDENLISQVIINLIKNAITAVSDSENAAICLSLNRSAEQLLLQVADNGHGIAKKHEDQVFIPFFTTTPGGSGIGLALSRQIVLRHHGSISFISEPNKKTVFTVTLPGY